MDSFCFLKKYSGQQFWLLARFSVENEISYEYFVIVNASKFQKKKKLPFEAPKIQAKTRFV